LVGVGVDAVRGSVRLLRDVGWLDVFGVLGIEGGMGKGWKVTVCQGIQLEEILE